MMKKQMFLWAKCLSLVLALVLLCVPLLTGATFASEEAPAEVPVPTEIPVEELVEQPVEEPVEEVAPVEVAPTPEPVWAVKPGTYDDTEQFPGAYSAEVYELVGFSTEDAEKFVTASTKQIEEETFARLLYLQKMRGYGCTLEEGEITSEGTLKEVAKEYELYLSLKEDWEKKAFQNNVQFYIDTLHMSREERLDFFYRQQGFDGTEGYHAWREEQDKISPEENARRLKEDADKQRAKMEALGIPHEHLTDEQVANP